MKLPLTKRRVLLALLTATLLTAATLLVMDAPSAKTAQGKCTKAETKVQPGNSQSALKEVKAAINEKGSEKAAGTTGSETGNLGKKNKNNPFPDESMFHLVAESGSLQLKADPQTGHFTVTHTATGQVWQSFPNPDGWDEKQNTPAWKLHLQAPFMFRYVEFNIRKDLDKESNFITQEGKVKTFETIGDGFRIVYELPDLGFIIPVEVRLKDDYVETRIVQEGLSDEKKYTDQELKDKKDPKARLVAIRLFPFLGAETSDSEDGFLLIPDGPGALIDFKKDQPDLINYYNERVYGEDWAYSVNASFSNRQPVKMPVFGIKSGKKAVLGVIHEGAEYASVFAVPSKSFSQYNWVTAEHQFRFKFFQPTDTRRNDGFFTYSSEITREDRATRYYFISGDPDYVDMAVRYRQYLMDEEGIKPLQDEKNKVPLHLNLLGADTEKGFIKDSYLPFTTTDQAKEIVRELHSLGVEQMSIVYMGWQKGGYSEYGGHYPVDKGIGGNAGLKTFVDYAHSKGFPVYLDASSYSYNNTGRDGFRKSRDGLRDLSSAVIKLNNKVTEMNLVSPKFMKQVISDDLQEAKDIHVDGYLYGESIGSLINSDYNENYAVMRQQARQIQENIMQETKEKLGSIQVSSGNMYTVKYADHLISLDSDYSYDMFVDRIVPFVQIALHGLVSYSLDYANLSGDYVSNYLKGIEYGGEPSFLITYASSQELLKSKSLTQFYSTNYQDWTEEMVSLYQRYNEALSGVRDQFITDHRQLAEGVFETIYSNGRRIVVNYNQTPYIGSGISVKAQDFTAEGGE